MVLARRPVRGRARLAARRICGVCLRASPHESRRARAAGETRARSQDVVISSHFRAHFFLLYFPCSRPAPGRLLMPQRRTSASRSKSYERAPLRAIQPPDCTPVINIRRHRRARDSSGRGHHPERRLQRRRRQRGVRCQRPRRDRPQGLPRVKSGVRRRWGAHRLLRPRVRGRRPHKPVAPPLYPVFPLGRVEP